MPSLPPELWQEILSHLYRRQDLFNACLVCSYWDALARPVLYEHVRLFQRDLDRVPVFFARLAQSPHLCALIRKLEVRVYPIKTLIRERRELEELAVQVLCHAINLQDLVWTRAKTLTDELVQAIVELPSLQSLEINGSTRLAVVSNYDVDLLLELPALKRLAIIMPDRRMGARIPGIIERITHVPDAPVRLEALSLLCRESPIVSSALMARIQESLLSGPSPATLKTLSLVGCTSLHDDALLGLLSALPEGTLEHLALESIALRPEFISAAGSRLSGLRSLKLTHPGPSSATYLDHVAGGIKSMHHLESFTLYYSGQERDERRRRIRPYLTLGFLETLAMEAGSRLSKLEASEVLVDAETLALLCSSLTRLQDLVVHVDHTTDLSAVTDSVAHLRQLRTLHIMCQNPAITVDDALPIATRCSPTLRQFGLRNRAFLVRHTPIMDEAVSFGERSVRTSLESWDLPSWPAAMLVMRS